MNITIPEFCLVVLIGPSGSGKSSFAAKHFLATEIISSDVCRGLVSDSENALEATTDAFDLVHFIAEKRLAARRLTVIDATSVRPEDRAKYVTLAKRYHALPVAVVMDLDERLCHARNQDRPDRQFGPHVVRNQARALKRGIKRLPREGFRYVHRLRSEAEVDGVSITRERLWTDRRDDGGPFDIIGDVHGCCDELERLLAQLGYQVTWTVEGEETSCKVTPPSGRRALFLGDLVDRGPRVPDVLRLVMAMVAAGDALCILGNHEAKVLRWLRGKKVQMRHGLAETAAQFETQSPAFREQVIAFLDGLISHYLLDDGKLVVAHAGIREEMQGRSSGAVRGFCLYGETTGETDEFGLPVRYNWAAEYRGKAKVVYGHTPVPEPDWLNGTVCIDNGCVFGGKLTALRYPEMELLSEPAAQVYAEPIRPLESEAPDAVRAQQEDEDLLDFQDVSGKRIITTDLQRSVTIRAENAAAALETMSRFAVDPRWLIYLPPTMAPSATSSRDGYLEHPEEAFAYFAGEGVTQVICEEKHMGSRAVMVVCRDCDAARRRFGVSGESPGIVYSRTGRPFFPDPEMNAQVLARVAAALGAADLWARLESDWVCLDAEIMPWSVKAQSLLQEQYAPVGAAGTAGLAASCAALESGQARGVIEAEMAQDFAERKELLKAYRVAYGHYCWPVDSIDDLKIAPFHLLASEGALHMDKDHPWHMAELARLAEADGGLFQATNHRLVNLDQEAEVAAAVEWWEALTAAGGEGMVVKPRHFIAQGKKGLAQPALKCRGREYLRIIYGPEYSRPEHLTLLRRRGLGLKRSLAFREFVLGHASLARFVAGAPLRQVHEAVFGVLALESEPVDPRL